MSGYDITDYLHGLDQEQARAWLHELAANAKPPPFREQAQLEEPQVDSLEDFIAVNEPGIGALLGTTDQNVIPVGGDAMLYGDGGAGKTTLAIDLALHLAAGVDWLTVTVQQPVNVLLLEVEGPRPLFRRKLRRRAEAWEGPPLAGRLIVWREPWGKFTFADEEMRAQLARLIYAHEIDLVIVGPLTSVGMEGAGLIRETRAFLELVGMVREQSLRPVTCLLVHHENKGGKVSGAWEGVGDTLLHVQGRVQGSAALHFQKTRWASKWTRRTLELEWAPGETFVVSEKIELSDESVAELLIDAIRRTPGASWSTVVSETKGVGDQTRRRIRNDLFAAGAIVNVVKEKGIAVALYECPERRRSRLYVTDHPDVAHLRLSSAAVEPQTEIPGVGGGGFGDLRPAAGLIEPQAVEPQTQHPRGTYWEPHDLRPPPAPVAETELAEGEDDW